MLITIDRNATISETNLMIINSEFSEDPIPVVPFSSLLPEKQKEQELIGQLMQFTIDYDGEQKTVTSFVKKENVNLIRNLPVYQSA